MGGGGRSNRVKLAPAPHHLTKELGNAAPVQEARCPVAGGAGHDPRACAEGSGPGSTSNSLTEAQATDLSSDVSSDLDDMIDFSSYDAFDRDGAGGGRGPRAGVHLPGCVSITPDPIVNSDGDAVPDSARFDYSACVFARWNGTVTDSLSVRSTSLTRCRPRPVWRPPHLHRLYPQAYQQCVPPAQLHRGAQWYPRMGRQCRYPRPHRDQLRHRVDPSEWPHLDSHQELAGQVHRRHAGDDLPDHPAAAGQLTVNGTGSWATLNRSWSVAVTTATPLVYDPTCTVAPRFTAGEVDLVVTRNGEVVNVSVVFTACGQYTVTRTPAA